MRVTEHILKIVYNIFGMKFIMVVTLHHGSTEHTTKTYLLITARTDEISDIHKSVIRIEVVEEREFS